MIQTLFFCFFLASTSFAENTFSPFQQILEKNLKEMKLPQGGVDTAFDYSGAMVHPDTKGYISKQKEILSKFDIKTLTDKKMANAFWINAYNFFMIAIILEKGVENNKIKIKSVKDLGTFFNPYKIFKEKMNNVSGTLYSLDDIEKGILLGEDFKNKKWKDARIHFAVNCASVGCPPLIKTVYSAEGLDQILDDNIAKALKNPRHFILDPQTLKLTHLFKWYQKDFEEHSGSVKDFIKKYLNSPEIQNQIDRTKNIDYIEYNWNLNKPDNF